MIFTVLFLTNCHRFATSFIWNECVLYKCDFIQSIYVITFVVDLKLLFFNQISNLQNIATACVQSSDIKVYFGNLKKFYSTTSFFAVICCGFVINL